MTVQIAGVDPTVPPSGTSCVECEAAGGWWLHLRRCANRRDGRENGRQKSLPVHLAPRWPMGIRTSTQATAANPTSDSHPPRAG